MTNIDDYKLDLDQKNDSYVIAGDSLENTHSKGKSFLSKLSKLILGNLKVTLPLILILVTGLLITFFMLMQPEAQVRRTNLTPPLTVSVYDLVSQDFQVNVQSYGTIAPRTQSSLISQVSGLVTEVGENMREGSFFSKGDVLLRIDDRDYRADLKISEANLASAQQELSEELALSRQAEEDWKRLGNTEPANDLVLRKPQQQAARAKLASAEAALSKAQLGLDRTQVVAPFDGRVLEQMVDVGQVASNNAKVAEVYSTDYVEIRLPLRDSDLQFVDLPEAYRGVGNNPQVIPVNIYSSLSDSGEPWLGKIVRTESAIDTNARQLHVVAQIDDPFGTAALGRTPLKIGEYVTAEIQGKTIADSIVIPSTVIYQDTYVYVVQDNILVRKEIDVIWKNTTEALIGSGLSAGDRVVTTTLGQVASGTRVLIEGEASPTPERRGGANRTAASEQGSRPNAIGGSNSSGERSQGGDKPTQSDQSTEAKPQNNVQTEK